MNAQTGKSGRMPDYPHCDLSMAGYDAQAARARVLGFTHVRGTVCLKKLVDPKHRDTDDARSDAEYRRLGALSCPYVFGLGGLGFDHARLWRTGDGELFATADVYDEVTLDVLDRLRPAERELDIKVSVTAMTMYAPGYSLMILVTAPGSSVSIHLGDGSAMTPANRS